MKITSSEIRDKLNNFWPNLEYVWLWDTTYWTPSLDAVQGALTNSNVPTMDFIDEFNDCDNFALQFVAECRRKRYFQWKNGNLPESERFTLTIGQVFGDMFRGMSKLHKCCFAICNDDNIYMLDATPSENRIWKAVQADDNALYIDM